MEVEANCKAVLSENGYARVGDWNMNDYRKLEATHRLSGYRVKMRVWQGVHHTFAPFDAWEDRTSSHGTMLTIPSNTIDTMTL